MRIGVPRESRFGETRAAATPKTVDQLLKLGYAVSVLSGAGVAASFADDAFREAFAKSPNQALRSIGHADAAPCIALKEGATLASPAQIKAQRSKLEQVMVGIQSQDCALSAQHGY